MIQTSEVYLLSPETLAQCMSAAQHGHESAQCCIQALDMSIHAILNDKHNELTCLCPECQTTFSRQNLPYIFVIAVPTFFKIGDVDDAEIRTWGICMDCAFSAGSIEVRLEEWLTQFGVKVRKRSSFH
jgi:hypothetical protein